MIVIIFAQNVKKYLKCILQVVKQIFVHIVEQIVSILKNMNEKWKLGKCHTGQI